MDVTLIGKHKNTYGLVDKTKIVNILIVKKNKRETLF